MTQPDPALVAAVVAAIRAQDAVGQLAPAVQGVPTRTALCCRLCGHELDSAQFGTYLGHCAANHHSLVERFAGPVNGADLDPSLARVTDPVDRDAWMVLAADVAERVTAWPTDPNLYLEQRELPVDAVAQP